MSAYKILWNKPKSFIGEFPYSCRECREIRQRLVKLEKVQAELSRVKENKELREHKENLIRADKRKSSYIEELEEENKKLREELSAYDREYFDEDKKAQYIFMDDDTLQELRDLGAI